MILQSLLTERIIYAIIGQAWPIIYLSIYAFKLLKRTKNRSTISLSMIFILNASGYLFAFFSIFTINTPMSFIFYLIAWYLILFSHAFFIIFSWILLHIDIKLSIKKICVFAGIYCLIVGFIIWIAIFTIKYDVNTEWRPVFSWLFAIINWMYIFIFLMIPELAMSFKLVKIFQGSNITIRIKLFLISSILEYIVISLLILYNTLDISPEIRSVITIFNIPLSMIAAYCIYRSFFKYID